MHVSGFPLDLNWFLQFIVTALVIAFGLLHLVKNTASKYFMVDANFDSLDARKMPPPAADSCVVCGNLTTKQCSGCKLVKYCSEACQRSHWNSGHKTKCKDFKLSGKVNSTQSASLQCGRRSSSSVVLVPDSRTSSFIKQPKEILFPYEDFVELFNWNKPGFPPCGLLNCGNSCFANVVLQCLAYTRPLVAYLLEKGHRRECRRNDWCFLCEFQTHVERASESPHPFSPINILSRLPNIGGNLGYGKQEDAHEFMRFAIDTMQSVCLDEFGGEKALHPSTQETTLIQHIFGGHLQSQVICTKCNKISNQHENMMDLTVEIQGDAGSIEECLDQFTVREQLHGDNMYKCDGCNDYVMAWKRLTVLRSPNVLTIALKRFQSGRFGKLNKRVTFPETLDLSPYMSEAGDGSDVYKLYAVVVHVDMLNASFFGHYICYTKDFCGNWYRIDDCKVTRADLEEVLSQGAYMLLYSRVCARPSCLKSTESLGKEQQTVKLVQEEKPCARQALEVSNREQKINGFCASGSLLSDDGNSQSKDSTCERELSARTHSEDVREDMEMVDSESSSSVPWDIAVNGTEHSNVTGETAAPVVRINRLVSGTFSSLGETSMTDAYTLNSESAFPNSGVKGENKAERNSTENLTDSSSESFLPSVSAKKLADPSSNFSVPMQNGVCEKGEMLHDASVGGLSSDELHDAVNRVDSKCGPEKMETGKLPSSSNLKDAAGKLASRNSSGGKLKPLFPPGFLGKRPANKSTKRHGEAPSALVEFASCNQTKGISEFSKPSLRLQNGASTKDKGKPHSKCISSSPPTLFEEKVENCLDKGTTALGESGELANLCNGDSAAFVISDDHICNVNPLSCNDEIHERGRASPSEKMGTYAASLVERDP
ncbi:Ubiquitin carboxyl-terminal hydrolase [Actinidia chinensis var. chinensis]|uniref:ubiquitinyl hydrolase 1 n=1 Tax=Actinidia chinensis var. chinensis TaxID=1590841 RepID=A0A2R6R4N7_ACTCC|nr:Ubiquitin carboxyl-terminal hydrolase [Actinidia chinensis var. chinensis]